MSLTKRVEVLFEPEKYRRLERIARARGETVASLVRKAVDEAYVQVDEEERRKAVALILGGESDVTWDDAKKFLEENTGRRL